VEVSFMVDNSELATQPQGVAILATLPRSASIIEAFRGAADTDPGLLVLDIAVELAANHQRQWQTEDACRSADATAEDIATAKRGIDELNSRRVALVEQLDGWIAGGARGRADASLHTETFGSVIDRLAIEWVRANNLINASDRDRARQALSQLVELAAAYDDLVRDVVAGRRRLPAWRPLKAYGVTG
jgi:hypothetical protein